MANRILIIGATGLLGAPVAAHLKQKGFIVRLLVRDTSKAAVQFGNEYEIIEGDVKNLLSIEKAMDNCSGVHINLSGEIEQTGVENISLAAKNTKLQRITYISGTSVAEENAWVPLMKRKFIAEHSILKCGVPYSIFCPTWFMEVLPKYVKNNRAYVFGKQPNPYHLIAAEDYARMVAHSYELEEAINKRFILHGPEGILFHEAVRRYCKVFHPEIQKVITMPHWLTGIVSGVTGNKQMKQASDFMTAFEKIGELGDPSEANNILGAPKITLNDWLQLKRSKKSIDE